jgi:bifunctional non-homologous end joining protein LigD
MQEASTYLFNTGGGSDKEYHAHLRQVMHLGSKEVAWVVQYANGPRGKVGQTHLKTPQPVDFASASKIYEALVKSKLKGGYTESETGLRFTNNEGGKPFSGLTPQLPTSIRLGDLSSYITNPSWLAQEKANGERRMLEIKNGKVRGINKLGQYVNVPEVWIDHLAPFGNCLLDGEQVGESYYAFDMLETGPKDLRQESFENRYRLLEIISTANASSSYIHLLRAASGEENKRRLLAEIERDGREGLVFKHKDAPSKEGRSDHILKFKLVESSTCLVEKVNNQRSVGLALMDPDGYFVSVGNVTIPSSHDIPDVGNLAEVQYLYFNPGGSFEQPVYLGKRTDITPSELTFSQITRLKPGVEMDAWGKRADATTAENQRERQRG